MARSTRRSAAITLIHSGDFHGHLLPRPNLLSDSGLLEGGLAYVHALVTRLRREHPHTLYIHTGDTIQGSAEALYTRGQALVDILNPFAIDAFVPGNWDFVYGTQRFLELFAGPAPLAPWGAIAANLYYSNAADDPHTPYPHKAGQRVLPPYLIKEIGNVKLGILGLTTHRGPQAVPQSVTCGFRFTPGDAEVAELVTRLRTIEKVDVVILASELGLAHNIRLAETHAGIDVVLSSDMHEQTHNAVVTANGTVIVEEGQDGTMMGALHLEVKDARVANWRWQPYRVTTALTPDAQTEARIAHIRKRFVAGPDFITHTNPFNGSMLRRPIDTVVGYTAVPLQRANCAHAPIPAVIEGTSHDFLADAFRAIAKAQIGAIRGFRYGTHVAMGPIKLEDLFHFIPIGPQIAVGNITGEALKTQIENAAHGALAPDLDAWTGGWLFNFSGVTMDLDPYRPQGLRASNIRIDCVPLDTAATYRYASYWYAGAPSQINAIPARDIAVLKEDDGATMDATEVVVKYLQSLPGQLARPALHRITLLQALPPPQFGNPEIQPLRGAVRNDDD